MNTGVKPNTNVQKESLRERIDRVLQDKNVKKTEHDTTSDRQKYKGNYTVHTDDRLYYYNYSDLHGLKNDDLREPLRMSRWV